MATRTRRKITAVLFDIDGTLVDSNSQHAAAWREALREAGYKFSAAEVHAAIGMGADNLLPALAGLDSQSREGKAIAARKDQLFRRKYIEQLKPFPQAKELLARCVENGFSVGIATSAKEELLNQLLDLLDARPFVERAATADEVERSKPSPDVITSAARKIHAALNETILIGDTPYDIAAAKKVGVDTVAVTCGGWTKSELAGAIAIYKDPGEIVTNFDRSPLMSKHL